MAINQNTVTALMPRSVVGAAVRTLPDEFFATVINSTPQAKQVGTILVDTAANSTAYTWTLNGTVQSITSDGSGTKIEIAAAIASKINSTPPIAMSVYAASDGVDTVTITALNPGIGFTLSDADANLTSTESVTANALAADVEVGRMVIVTSSGLEKKGGKPLTTLLSAQVDQYLVVYDASVILGVVIVIEEQRYEASVTMATDAATSVAALVVALNYILPANTVLASNSTATLILTAEVAGKAFHSDIFFGVGADTAAATKTSTEGIYGTDIVRMLGGVSSYTYGEENISLTDNGIVYPKNSGVKTQIKDDVWVADPGSVVADGWVWVETASGASTGLLKAASSATRIRLPKSVASWVQTASTESLAAVRLNIPA